MLDNLASVEEQTDGNKYDNGWLAVYKLFLLEYPQSKFTIEEIAEKYWNLSINPGSSQRKSVFDLMLYYKESVNKQGNQTITQQPLIGENGEIKFLKMEL